MRPAAKGIQTIRHCIGALLWDCKLITYRAHASVEDWLTDAQKLGALPGGKYPKWLAEHRQWAYSYLFVHFPDNYALRALDRAETPHDKECMLYHIHRSGPTLNLVETEATKLGLRFIEHDKHYTQYGAPRLAEATLEGHAASCRLLGRSFSSPFWVAVWATITECDARQMYHWAGGDAKCIVDYELGTLHNDLEHFGLSVPPHVSSLTLPCSVFALRVNAAAKRAVDTWLLLATRLRVVKDIRRVIGLLLWSERLAWAETVFYANDSVDVWDFSDAAPPLQKVITEL